MNKCKLITTGLSALLFFGCDYMAKKPLDCVTVIIDKSDEMVMATEITASDILRHLRLDSITNYSYGAQVILTTVSSFRGNQVFQTELKAESPSESNHRNRARAISQLAGRIQNDLQTIQQDAAGTPYSRVFFSLFSHIEKISECSICACSQMTILFISDLQQHSPDEFSVLRDADWALLTTNPKAIESYLDTAYPLNAELVRGIRVVFCFRPTTMTEDQRFHVMASFLATYLTKKGITVETRTSFN